MHDPDERGLRGDPARDPVARRGTAAGLRREHRNRDLRPGFPVVVVRPRRPVAALETPDIIGARGDGAVWPASEMVHGRPGPASPFDGVDLTGPRRPVDEPHGNHVADARTADSLDATVRAGVYARGNQPVGDAAREYDKTGNVSIRSVVHLS